MSNVPKESDPAMLEFSDDVMLNLIKNVPVTFVTGKGGVGKTTIANLLAKSAHSHGERTLFISLVEDPTTKITLGADNELKPGIEPIQSTHGYDVAFITPSRALTKYLNDKKLSMITSRLESSSLLDAIANTVPGMRELLTLSAIKSLANSKNWDRIIIDAPSTGHALALFNVTESTSSISDSGVISDQSKSAHEFLHDEKTTQVLVVSLDQHMVLEESKELIFELEENSGLNICAILINKFNDKKIERTNEVLDGIYIPIYRYPHKSRNKKASYIQRAFGFNKLPNPLNKKLTLSKKSKLCLVLGTGGVGKTTLSAAIAFAAVNENNRVGLLTIDPARRLGTALGLENNKEPLDKTQLKVGNKESSNFHIYQLNSKSEFMRLLKDSLNEKDFHSCEQNSFVTSVASMGIINEYMAIEAMHRLISSGDYDTVVIDTPPSHHLNDLLETPDAIRRAINSPLYNALVGAGTITSWGANAAMKTILRPLKSLVGADLISDAVTFLKMLKDVEVVFSEHAAHVKEALSAQNTLRVGICSTDLTSRNHLFELATDMKAKNYGLNNVVINGYQQESETLEEIATFASALKQKQISTALFNEFDQTLPLDIVTEMSKQIAWRS